MRGTWKATVSGRFSFALLFLAVEIYPVAGHYEWQISFPPYDIDMSAIQAKFESNGHLYIDVRRLTLPGNSHR
jgi:hypothetical protein